MQQSACTRHCCEHDFCQSIVSFPADQEAAETYMQFQLGWIADPLFFGDYPEVLRLSQKHLPKFKESEKKLLAGSVDFFALNYYTSHFVSKPPLGAPADQVGELFRVRVTRAAIARDGCCLWLHCLRSYLPSGHICPSASQILVAL